jgi:hypothetical protein
MRPEHATLSNPRQAFLACLAGIVVKRESLMHEWLRSMGAGYDWYILDERNQAVSVSSEEEAMRWRGTHKEQCLLGKTLLWYQGEEIAISTIFLSLNHRVGWGWGQPAILFETLVMGPDAVIHELIALSETDPRSQLAQCLGCEDLHKRYATYAEAVQGHQTMVAFVEVCLTKMESEQEKMGHDPQ